MPKNTQDITPPTIFITRDRFILGFGESLEELEEGGEWISTDNPIDVEM